MGAETRAGLVERRPPSLSQLATSPCEDLLPLYIPTTSAPSACTPSTPYLTAFAVPFSTWRRTASAPSASSRLHATHLPRRLHFGHSLLVLLRWVLLLELSELGLREGVRRGRESRVGES